MRAGQLTNGAATCFRTGSSMVGSMHDVLLCLWQQVNDCLVKVLMQLDALGVSCRPILLEVSARLARPPGCNVPKVHNMVVRTVVRACQ